MEIIFEWDTRKAQINFDKHSVGFDEARTVFHDPYLLTFADELHSETEDRFVSIGVSELERILLVVYTEHEQKSDRLIIRVISCRKATLSERKTYDERK